MTQLFKKAKKKDSSLRGSEEGEIARLTLNEIEDEKLWEEQFESTQNELLIMAHEALKEEKLGRTKKLRLLN